MKCKFLVACFLSTLVLFPSGSYAKAEQAVLVTGASSGIGRAMTEMLASNGYFVYAGARKQKDLDALNKLKNVESIPLDVTNQAQIDAAVLTITNAGRGLYGIVNNAGVSNYEALIEVDEDKLDFVFDVNVFGVYRVTKAFIPLVIQSKGRVVNISSMAGIVSAPIMGVYSMSKHAVEAYSDALSAELARVNVKVSIIEPGRFRSKINQNAIERMGQGDENSLWAKERLAMVNRDRSQDKDPSAVAKAVMHALFSDVPKKRYLVVPNRGSARYTIKAAMQKLVQLNTGQPYSLDRNTLVKMLDDSLVVSGQ